MKLFLLLLASCAPTVTLTGPAADVASIAAEVCRESDSASGCAEKSRQEARRREAVLHSAR